MIYFDNSATTKPYQEVIDSYVKVSSEYFGNPSSLHGIGGQAEKLLTQARAQLASLLNVKPSEILFTSGGTESNNLAVKGAALAYKGRGRHIITTEIEHASVRESVQQLEEAGFRISYIPVNSDGHIDVRAIEQEICDDTIIVSVIHVNNEVGSIQPVKEIGELLKAFPKVLFHVDYVQGAGKVPINLYESGIDLCSISGHKFHGLKGTGALFIREGVRLSPLLTGGSQEGKRRSGTENVAGFVAMAKALRMTLERRDTKMPEMNQIMTTLRTELAKIKQIVIHTPEENAAPHILNFSVEGFKAEVFVHALEEMDIFVSTTSACSSKRKSAGKTLLAMGVPAAQAESAIRISLSFDNTMDEARRTIQAIEATLKRLGEVMRK
ncbi:cysteine desulfurase family protein [Bacillus sp. T33-2]|uniref:cysteine desulfurase family protein n=1 Tax=Bacillus sp. T33-2 TaxID=2054168 RepID=UPI000C76CBE6|nr:cysteine desulfurase family protein [Bacillus sp. T33-2]PLR98154.1 cysteine desulfurase NifS [Bacillus sp. T33-2]